ncbi:hypothetical protein TNCT_648511 [Trichonephila clavata]|uniref:Uncharacterized protein n=1 Tax=Trichonephila clavata TaxID=2740835 RepID=A0A8X6FI40_TRICU|nr:hypothetical protein TNCT_648511 [Trichonephila clavata]
MDEILPFTKKLQVSDYHPKTSRIQTAGFANVRRSTSLWYSTIVRGVSMNQKRSSRKGRLNCSFTVKRCLERMYEATLSLASYCTDEWVTISV